MQEITKIEAVEIKDSKGNPTIKTTVWVGEVSGSFSVPSGSSTGSHEAHILKDEDGLGVKNAIEKIDSVIAPKLIGVNIFDQTKIDEIMIRLDGTSNKENLGGNSTISVSIACAKAAAKAKKLELFQYLQTLGDIKPSRKIPHFYMNLIEGGKHTKGNLSIQEYLIVTDIHDAKEAYEAGMRIIETLKEIIEEKLGEESTILGDEGGFAIDTSDPKLPMVFLTEAIKKNGLEGKVRLALDAAANTFYENGTYEIGEKIFKRDELLEFYKSLAQEFDLFSIEDPFFEEDFEGFGILKEKLKKIFIVGDDLTVSNKKHLEKAIEKKSINAMIIKPNQIGTLSETLETMKLARENDIELIVSHRGEETEDDFIADLSFAFGCFGLKAGSPLKPERKAKYDRLISITQDKNSDII